MLTRVPPRSSQREETPTQLSDTELYHDRFIRVVNGDTRPYDPRLSDLYPLHAAFDHIYSTCPKLSERNPELSSAALRGIQWIQAIVKDITGFDHPIVEPRVAPRPDDKSDGFQVGSQIYLCEPFVDREQQRYDQHRTIESLIELQSVSIHEWIHFVRRMVFVPPREASSECGPRPDSTRSGRVIRQGFRQTGFNKDAWGFLFLTEAAASIAQAIFLLENGFDVEGWKRYIPPIPQSIDSSAFRRLYEKVTPPPLPPEGGSGSDISRQNSNSESDLPPGLDAPRFYSAIQDRNAHIGYAVLLPTMASLARQFYRNEGILGAARTGKGALYRLFADLMIAESQSKPQVIFRQIKRLAENDIRAAGSGVLGDQFGGYMKLFFSADPSDNFDCLVLHMFAEAGERLKAHEVGPFRQELVELCSGFLSSKES